MIITVFGATGQVGKRIVSMGLAQGHHIRAFGRNVESLIDADLRNDQLKAIKGYVFNEADVHNAVKGADAVISVLGGLFDGTDKTRSLGMKNIVAQMEATGVQRIVALGGMGILNADASTLLIDTPGYPDIYLPVGREHQQAYETLQASALQWTFVCAPDIKDEPDTGEYVTNANYPPEPNHYRIAAGNLAHFMLQELTENRFVQQRVGISD